MNNKLNIPDGYIVFEISEGNWRWESIMAPASHSRGGFTSEEDAAADCRASNNMG